MHRTPTTTYQEAIRNLKHFGDKVTQTPTLPGSLQLEETHRSAESISTRTDEGIRRHGLVSFPHSLVQSVIRQRVRVRALPVEALLRQRRRQRLRHGQRSSNTRKPRGAADRLLSRKTNVKPGAPRVVDARC